MRLHRAACILATATAVGSAAPTASAFDASAPVGGGEVRLPVIQPHRASSPDWLLIGVAAGAATALGAGGLTVKRGPALGAPRSSRRARTTSGA